MAYSYDWGYLFGSNKHYNKKYFVVFYEKKK